MIYSFDIFDTLVTRDVCQPTDIFFLMESQLANRIGFKIDKFGDLRIKSEKISRRNSLKEEITLDEIYFQMNQKLNLQNQTIEKLKRLEVKLEIEHSYPIKENIERLKKYIEQDAAVIISDMYLSKSDICKILLNNDIRINPSKVFVSSEIGLTKRSGRLFEYVAKKLKIDLKDLSHIGDNSTSDYRIPLKMGITSSLYSNSHMNRYEKMLIKKNYKEIANCSRLTRLTKSEGCSNELWNTASSVVAPILLGYLNWIKIECEKKQIFQLFFVSRDGELMYKAWTMLFGNSKIKAKYIYGSRYAWYLAGIKTKEEYSRAIKDGWAKIKTGVSIDSCLKTLHFSDEIISEIKNRYDWGEQVNEKNLQELIDVLQEDKYAEIILKQALTERSLVLEYFRQEGVICSSNIAFVDLGWTGKSLETVRDIIIGNGENKEVYGYVLGKRKTVEKDLPWFYSWMFDGRVPCLQSEVYLLETMFAATHGTVVGYKKSQGSVSPLLRVPDSKIRNHGWNVFKHQESIKMFMDIYCKRNFKQIIDNSTAKEIFETSVLSPKLDDVIAYKDYPFSTLSGDIESLNLAAKKSVKDFLAELQTISFVRAKMFKKQKQRTIFWKEGTAKISGAICIGLSRLDNILVRFMFYFFRRSENNV